MTILMNIPIKNTYPIMICREEIPHATGYLSGGMQRLARKIMKTGKTGSSQFFDLYNQIFTSERSLIISFSQICLNLFLKRDLWSHFEDGL